MYSKYLVFNNNKTREKEFIAGIMNKINLDEVQKEYINGRFFDAYYALDRLAINNKAFFQVLKIGIMLCSILIVALINFSDNSIVKVIIIIISALSPLLFGLLQYFKNDTMWAHHRLKFESIKKELYLFFYLGGSYKAFKDRGDNAHKEAFYLFVEKVELLFDLEIKDYFANLQIGANYVEVYKKKELEVNLDNHKKIIDSNKKMQK